MSGKSRRPAPLADGYISRSPDGSFRGAGGSVGLNETIGGTNLQALNVGGDFGWGGDAGLYGARANATLAGVSNDPAKAGESGFWGGVRTFDAGAGAYWDSENGMGELGYRADLVSGEVGYREVNGDSGADRGGRVGGSVGVPSGGVRVYNQDADGDGRNEYGLGLSLPVPGTPFGLSGDYTTETPIGDAVTIGLPAMLGLGPLGLVANEGMEAMGLEDYAPATLVQNGAESLWDTASSWFD